MTPLMPLKTPCFGCENTFRNTWTDSTLSPPIKTRVNVIHGLGEQWDREGVRGAEAARPPRQLFPGHRGSRQGRAL